jgi:predicted transcriptional regulator
VAQLHHAEDRFSSASAVPQGRPRSGLTQRRLAVLAGLPKAKISRIEAGVADPTLSTLGALARTLDIELHIGRLG